MTQVELSLSRSTVDGVEVLAVQGEVDVSSAPQLLRELTAIQSGGTGSVVIDLTGVGFLDSTGLGALVAARASAAESGGTVALVCAQERILKLFTITGLDGAFEIHPTVEAAVRGLAS